MNADRFDRVGSKYVARSYGDYLDLDSITCERTLLSGLNPPHIHDEHLFVDIHRNIEIWLFQLLVEIRQARLLIQSDKHESACEELERVVRILNVLTLTWDVLATLRPREFWKFRDYFGKASGFQSSQFRQFEFILGHRVSVERDLATYRGLGDLKSYRALNGERKRPSLWDEVILGLARAGFPLDGEVIGRDWRKPHDFSTILTTEVGGKEIRKRRPGNASVVDAWFQIYSERDDPVLASFYRLGERLLDLSAGLAAWRFKHIVTVERYIGGLPGSGGSSGVPYLLRTLKHRVFPELWTVRDRFREWSSDYRPPVRPGDDEGSSSPR